MISLHRSHLKNLLEIGIVILTHNIITAQEFSGFRLLLLEKNHMRRMDLTLYNKLENKVLN